VNPAALHNPLVEVDGANMYSAVITTGVPIAMAAKSPLLPPCTVTLLKELTLVAVFSDFVSKVAVPAMFNMPVIGTAWTKPAVSTTAAIVKSVFDNFITLLRLWIFIANKMRFHGTSTDDGKKQPSESTLFSNYFRNLSVFIRRMEKEWASAAL
jgi:hypothetical protein